MVEALFIITSLCFIGLFWKLDRALKRASKLDDEKAEAEYRTERKALEKRYNLEGRL